MIDYIKNYIHPNDDTDYSVLCNGITCVINVDRENYEDVYKIYEYLTDNYRDHLNYLSKMREGHITFGSNNTDCPTGVVLNASSNDIIQDIEQHLVVNKLSGNYRCQIDMIDFGAINAQKQEEKEKHFNSLFEYR
jgi:hypothetical protein